MGTIVGVVVGYALGARAGEQGWAEIEEAWEVIRHSEEVRDLVMTGFSLVRGDLGRASALLGGSDAGARLRSVA